MGSDGAGDPSHQRARAAFVMDGAALQQACAGFHKAFPRRSARRTFHFTQLTAFAALATLIAWSFQVAPELSLSTLHACAYVAFAIMIFWRLIAAASLQSKLSRLADPMLFPTYTILCPLYREGSVTADLVAALERLDYPKQALDIKLLVEADDIETLVTATSAATAPHIEVVIVKPASPRTKPKALNVGLARARGEYVVVYDAEDRPHPQQLRAALAAFEDGGECLACVQAPLSVDNPDASWIARQFAAEYAIQFREILPLLARLGLPLPLGGSSNHFRIEALRAAGGWDPFNVTEDADLGYRLARDGWRADVIAPPTWEEAPITLGAWLGQRTRWIKGHMQTWLVLMRNPVRTAREMGLASFASMQLILGGGIAAACVHGPIACILLVAALSPYDILGPADFVLALVGYCVAAFTALTASALTGSLNHARAALLMPFYWPLASIAAARAAVEILLRPHHWSKTIHGVSARARLPTKPPPNCHVSGPRLRVRWHT